MNLIVSESESLWGKHTHTHTHAMAEVKRTKRRRGGHPFTPDGKDF